MINIGEIGHPVLRVGERALAFLALLFGGAAIGFSAIFVRLADVGPLQSAF